METDDINTNAELEYIKPKDEPSSAEEQTADADPTLGDAEMLAGLLGLVIDLKFPYWHFRQDHAMALAKAYIPVIEKWAPWLLKIGGVEVQAVLVTVAVLQQYKDCKPPKSEKPIETEAKVEASNEAGL